MNRRDRMNADALARQFLLKLEGEIEGRTGGPLMRDGQTLSIAARPGGCVGASEIVDDWAGWVLQNLRPAETAFGVESVERIVETRLLGVREYLEVHRQISMAMGEQRKSDLRHVQKDELLIEFAMCMVHVWSLEKIDSTGRDMVNDGLIPRSDLEWFNQTSCDQAFLEDLVEFSRLSLFWEECRTKLLLLYTPAEALVAA